jgi:hypothetical protein
MIEQIANIGAQMLASKGIGSLFGGNGGDNIKKLTKKYKKDVMNVPDYSYLSQDPTVLNLRGQGEIAGNVGAYNALQQLIRSGFGRSNIGAVSAQRAGSYAKQPYVNQEANLLTELMNQAEQRRIQALRDVLSARLERAGKSDDMFMGLQSGLGKGVLDNISSMLKQKE